MELNIQMHGANLANERRNAFALSPTMRQTLLGLANQASLPGLLEIIICMVKEITLMTPMKTIIHQTRQVLDLQLNRV